MLRTWVFLSVLAAFAVSAVARAETQTRDFYQAVQDTLGDFEHDLKNETVKGAQNIAIRDIVMSERIPRSFGTQLETMIIEKFMHATKSKVIQCIGCKARRMTLERTKKGDQLRVTSARGDVKEQARVAKARGIERFLDVTFTYQPTGILLSMTITEPGTGTISWSRTYNSETSRAALARRGYELEVMNSSTRKATEYPATLQYRVRVDYLFEPNVNGQSGCIGIAFRMVERYDNRKKELGFEFEYLKDSSTLIGSSSGTNLYSGINLTMLVLHAWNLIGGVEDFDRARGGFYVGLGGTFTSGYLGALVRGGFEWRLAKHVAVTLHTGYRPASTAFLSLGGSSGQSVAGFEYGGGISYLF